MRKMVEDFLDKYGKYIAAAALAGKTPTRADIDLMIELFRNDSHR